MLLKSVAKSNPVWLILLAIWSFSTAAYASAPSCHTLFEPGKVAINRAGESAEEMVARLQLRASFVLPLGHNRVVGAQFISAAAGQPTFLFLPGVNRSLSARDSDVQLVARMGAGVITFDFSTQPLSVIQLPEGTTPYFLNSDVQISLPFLAHETEMVAGYFQQQGVKNIIPVALSFTGAIGPYLKGFPLVIETSPMTSSDATNPELAANIAKLKNLEIFNPIFGPAINRNLIDQAYRKNWTAQVERIVGALNPSPERKEQMIEGYLAMSHAAEGFDWNQVEIKGTTHHAFIIGDQESPSLLRSQVETYLRLSRAGKNVSFFLVGGAGHIVSQDQPGAYASILVNLLAPMKMNEEFGGGIFNKERKEFVFMDRRSAEDFAEKILKALNEQVQNAK